MIHPAALRATPAAVILEGNFARAQLVAALGPDGSLNERSADLTRQAVYLSSNPQVASVLFGATRPEQVLENAKALDVAEAALREVRRVGAS